MVVDMCINNERAGKDEVRFYGLDGHSARQTSYIAMDFPWYKQTFWFWKISE